MKRKVLPIATVLSLILQSGCNYNPFIGDNHLSGSPGATVVGAGAGVGIVSLFRGSPPALVLGGLTGGALGYYSSTLRYDAGGLIQGGGQMYKLGDFVGINIPTDKLFIVNTDDFTYQAPQILDSAATILQRYPNNNILVSGNTSGFARPRWERQLSLKRAQKVAAYFWNAGINQFKDKISGMRKLNYVGYGDYFPIASDHTNNGIRENSRIQITSYPDDCDLHLDKRHAALNNVGGMDTSDTDNAASCKGDPNCYEGEG